MSKPIKLKSIDAFSILQDELGITVPGDSFLDKSYVAYPLGWYLKSSRWFLGFELLEYTPEGNDCDDFYRTQREDYQKKHRKSKYVKDGAVACWMVGVMAFNGPHALAAVITNEKKVVLLERGHDDVHVAKRVISIDRIFAG